MPDQTTKPDTAAATAAVPSVAQQIRALLPDYTHEKVEGWFPTSTRWTWTTPLGTWTVYLGKVHLVAPPVLSFTGPGGEWTFAWPDERGVGQLAIVLRALDAIGGDDRG